MEVTHQRTTGPLPAALFADGRLDDLATWGRRLADLGVSPAASGNLSCRSEGGFIVTCTGVPLGEIRPEHWVEVTGVAPLPPGGLRVDSRGFFDPSKDASVHAAIYGHPSAMAVFHLHPNDLEELTVDLGVPTTAAFHPAGTVESVQEIERFLSTHADAAYFVLVEHGIVSWGATIDEVGDAVEHYHGAIAGLRS